MSEGPITWSVSYLILGEPVLYSVRDHLHGVCHTLYLASQSCMSEGPILGGTHQFILKSENKDNLVNTIIDL